MVQGLHEGRDATCTAAPDRTPTNLSSCAPPCSQLPGCPQFPAFIRHVFSPGTQTWPFLRLALHTCCPAKVPRAPLGRCFPRELRKEHRCLVARTLAGPPGGPSPCRHLPSLPRVVPGPMARPLSFLPGSRPSAPHQRGPGPLSATRLALWPGDRSRLRLQAASGSSHLEAPAPSNENHSDHSKQSTHRVHTKSHHPKCRVIITSSHPHKRVCELVVHPFTDEETEAQS